MKPTPELLKVPFDEIYLPSMGLFYPTHKHVLKVRALTGYDEILLSSPYLAQTGNAIKMLFNNVVLENDIEYDDLLLCDRDAILLFLRSTTYGDSIETDFICPECHTEEKGALKISSIEAKEISYMPNDNGEYEFLVPSSLLEKTPVQINFSPIKVSHIKSDQDNELLNRYMTQIISINDVGDKDFIYRFIKNMKAKDSKKLREFMNKVEPGFDETITHVCSVCGYQKKEVVKIDDNFLALPDTYRNIVNEECFLTYYYGKGGINRNEAYEMTVVDRRWTINRISEEIEKQNKAEKAAVDKAKNKR